MQCTHYIGISARCQAEATVWLITPDGRQCPGAWVCQRHGQKIIEEYEEKLGQIWTLNQIDQYGNRKE